MNLTTIFRSGARCGARRRSRTPKRILVVEQLETRNLLSFVGTPYAVGPTVTLTGTCPSRSSFSTSCAP